MEDGKIAALMPGCRGKNQLQVLLLFNPDEEEIQDKADLSVLISSIELACKVIASLVRRTGVTELYGLDGAESAKGGRVKKPDVLANKVFINSQKVRWRSQLGPRKYCKAFVNECKSKPVSYNAR
ncbi:hypothetical protein PInf_015686 [Phytophthora infestans]|nr:hypothetical protein PInf_015686 [Phytophthora infestans]